MRGVTDRLRVLVAGWLNSPHVRAWAELVAAAGHDVQIAGRIAPGWPELDLPVPAHRLPASWPPPLRGFAMSRALGRLAREVEPDLVHAHYLPEYGWMGARERLRPLICSAWGSDVFGLNAVNRPRAKKALEAAALTFADSKHLARATRALAGREVRVEVVRWGLDLEAFSPGDRANAREALGIPVSGPLVASVRGLNPVYNPDLILAAFARVRRSHPEARLLLKHPLAVTPDFVAGAIERHALGDAVTVLGNVAAERLPDVYRAADVVVSLASTDSSPRSVWEALACGRPAVVSDLPWARDELTDGALLVPLDAEQVADAVQRVLVDPGLAARLGKNGRALAIAELDPRACAERVDGLYRSVTEGRT
jgi:glycosyltransferase involved in cell wall biosynthesis